MISQYLGRGKDAALTTSDLMAVTGLSKRDLQKAIAAERADGALILSTCQGHGGFYMPSCSAELKEYVDSMSRRAMSTFIACRAARRALKAMEQQEQGQQIALGENPPDAAPER